MTAALLATARHQVLDLGIGLAEPQALACLQLDDNELPALLELAHQVRLRWCGPQVEVEGIVSARTGGCPEDCHFCSQSGQFDSPVRAVRLDLAELVAAAKATRASGASEFCIVAAVRGPDQQLLDELAAVVTAIRAELDIDIACSLGLLTEADAAQLAALGIHRYNHNLETARSHFPAVVSTHTFEQRWQTCQLVRRYGMQLCCGVIIGLGESLAQRAELGAQLAELDPHEVPLNLLNPRPGTPLADAAVVDAATALRTAATLRLMLPRAVIRLAGGRELVLGTDGAASSLRGGANALIAGNYLTTLGRPAGEDLALVSALGMPVAAPSPSQ